MAFEISPNASRDRPMNNYSTACKKRRMRALSSYFRSCRRNRCKIGKHMGRRRSWKASSKSPIAFASRSTGTFPTDYRYRRTPGASKSSRKRSSNLRTRSWSKYTNRFASLPDCRSTTEALERERLSSGENSIDKVPTRYTYRRIPGASNWRKRECMIEKLTDFPRNRRGSTKERYAFEHRLPNNFPTRNR